MSHAEHTKPVYDENDSVNLEEVTKQLEEQKVENCFPVRHDLLTIHHGISLVKVLKMER